jgi:F420-non-reducing hydrogenase iron-sulfur subunit
MTVKRITYLQELLAFMGLKGRLHLEWISAAESQKFVQVVTDFTEKIKALGPSPLAVFIEEARANAPKAFRASAGKIKTMAPDLLFNGMQKAENA